MPSRDAVRLGAARRPQIRLTAAAVTAKRSPLLPGWTSWLAATTLPMLAVGMSASAALHVIAADRDATVPAAPGAAGRYESEDHFPGAAAFYAAGDEASAAPGTTGTTALPTGPVPTDTALDPLDGTVRPALPFSTAAASTIDRGRALQCLTAAIYYEAASESDDGQRAVAQVVLNRVRHPAFPATVCGVVYQGSDQPTGCQFSFACDGGADADPGGWRMEPRAAYRRRRAGGPGVRAGRAGDALPYLCGDAVVEPDAGDDRRYRRALLSSLEGVLGHPRRVPPALCRWRTATGSDRPPAGRSGRRRGDGAGGLPLPSQPIRPTRRCRRPLSPLPPHRSSLPPRSRATCSTGGRTRASRCVDASGYLAAAGARYLPSHASERARTSACCVGSGTQWPASG